MPADDKAARERLGKLLVRRRVDMDRRYKNRRVFADEREIPYHLVYNIENGRQARFEPATVAVIEAAWDLDPEAIERVLAGGELVLDTPPDEPDTSDSDDSDDEVALRRELVALRREMAEFRREIAERREPRSR